MSPFLTGARREQPLAALAARVLAVGALSASLALGACVTLFPKSPPAQLYRFGSEARAESPPAPTTATMAPIGLRLTTGFTRAAEGDRLLTISGDQTAYIANSRWVEPASVLFDEAAVRAFEASNTPFRLLQRGDIGSSSLTLRLDVETFEADYGAGWTGSPTVVVRVRALLTGSGEKGVPIAQVFECRTPAGENRVGAIVAAYGAAANDVLGQVLGWATAQSAAISSSG